MSRARTPGADVGPVAEASPGLVVVGAGPHALTVTAELVVDGLVDVDDVVVLDPTGRWMAHWERAFRRLGITHLRSPVVHHPHPDVDAILRRPDLCDDDVLAGEVPVPSHRIFMAVANELIDELGLARCVVPARVGALHLVDEGVVDLECDDGTVLRAGRVVVATNTAVPVTVEGLEPRAVPEPPQVTPGDRVTVIGGGLSAAQIVRCVLGAGAQVTLVTRRPIVERAFDVDPGWMGPKYLAEFSRLADPGERVATSRSARGGGTMPAGDHEWLRTLAASGRIDLREGVAAIGVERVGDRTRVRLVDGSDVCCDHVVAAVGSRFDVEADPLLGPFVAGGHLSAIDGYPLLDPALRVPETPIHVTGRAAMVELGPAAGNLSGARRAARRIAAHLAGVDPAKADPGISNQPIVPSRSGRVSTVSGRSWLG